MSVFMYEKYPEIFNNSSSWKSLPSPGEEQAGDICVYPHTFIPEGVFKFVMNLSS